MNYASCVLHILTVDVYYIENSLTSFYDTLDFGRKNFVEYFTFLLFLFWEQYLMFDCGHPVVWQ
jgi:hypothetical protein